ncbi:MAG TPA: S1 RNA-binding domain-containing protein, partial [Candidatus Humimicrobiaceae bacterium]|nr:S1 RNA-binding domain-containing protein [Candidatus Humimicrobiaceae bacterium]
ELSWNHVKHPSEVVSVNQEVDVEILDIDYEKQRLSLGLKQTQKDPWLEKIKNYSIKDIVKGKVTRIVKFGLFVQVEGELEGLVHISELSTENVKRPSDVAKIGDELMVRIIDIDFDKRRMAFSVRQVENPVEEKEEEKETRDSESDKISVKKETSKKESKKTEEKEEVSGKVIEESPDKEPDDKESSKKRQIKEILKEMKDEAKID